MRAISPAISAWSRLWLPTRATARLDLAITKLKSNSRLYGRRLNDSASRSYNKFRSKSPSCRLPR